LRNGNRHREVTLHGRTLDAVVHARLGEIGKVDIDKCHFQIDGRGPLDASSWERAWGTLTLDSDVDLAHIRRLLPKGSVSLTDLAGRLRLKGEVKRASAADAVPEVRLSVETHGLVMSGRGDVEQLDGVRVLDTPPWSLEGVDVQLAARVAADSGATELNAKIYDRQGVLASLDVRSPVVPTEIGCTGGHCRRNVSVPCRSRVAWSSHAAI
jgi:hypothetical protein